MDCAGHCLVAHREFGAGGWMTTMAWYGGELRLLSGLPYRSLASVKLLKSSAYLRSAYHSACGLGGSSLNKA